MWVVYECPGMDLSHNECMAMWAMGNAHGACGSHLPFGGHLQGSYDWARRTSYPQNRVHVKVMWVSEFPEAFCAAKHMLILTHTPLWSGNSPLPLLGLTLELGCASSRRTISQYKSSVSLSMYFYIFDCMLCASVRAHALSHGWQSVILTCAHL